VKRHVWLSFALVAPGRSRTHPRGVRRELQRGSGRDRVELPRHPGAVHSRRSGERHSAGRRLRAVARRRIQGSNHPARERHHARVSFQAPRRTHDRRGEIQPARDRSVRTGVDRERRRTRGRSQSARRMSAGHGAKLTVTDHPSGGGHTVPFIVRVETGSVDRGQYQIGVLYNPAKPWSPWRRRRAGITS
jgi:hypothetical protein